MDQWGVATGSGQQGPVGDHLEPGRLAQTPRPSLGDLLEEPGAEGLTSDIRIGSVENGGGRGVWSRAVSVDGPATVHNP